MPTLKPWQSWRQAVLCTALVASVRRTRGRLIADSDLGLTEVAWHSEPSQVFLGSPSILRLRGGDLIATVDRFGSGTRTEAHNASLYRSRDNGSSWAFEGWIVSQYWSNLFQLNSQTDEVFIIGTNDSGPSAAKIARSHDGGVTWDSTDAAIIATGCRGVHNASGFETGPTPALLASDGRVYRAVELMPSPHEWPQSYQAVMLSASASSDLIDPTNWRVSAPLPFNRSWLPASWGPLSNPGYLEGNAVEGPAGEIFNVLRLNSMPVGGNKAVLLQYDPLANDLRFRRVLDLPGGHTKFVIRRDPETKLYLTLSNNNTVVGDPSFFDQRNILTLCTSPDLVNWTIIGTLLADDTGFPPEDSVRFTGFHYVDWQIDGDDLIYLVRTAYRGAVSYHNSNRITFKRLRAFRSYLPGGGEPVAAATVHGVNFSVHPLRDGAQAFSNRGYAWEGVPASLVRSPPLEFTMLAGGSTNTVLTAQVTTKGRLYVGSADFNGGQALAAAGFTALDPMLMSMHYTDKGATLLRLFSKDVNSGDQVAVPQVGWAGSVLIGALQETME